MEREVAEARRVVKEGAEEINKRPEKEVDKVITNANVLRFQSLSWYGEKHAQALAEA